jgi:hypothetical protein
MTVEIIFFAAEELVSPCVNHGSIEPRDKWEQSINYNKGIGQKDPLLLIITTNCTIQFDDSK